MNTSAAIRRALSLLLAVALLPLEAAAGRIERPAMLPRVITLASPVLGSNDPVQVSAAFVDAVIHDDLATPYLGYFQSLGATTLQRSLSTPPRQLAFWINVYNGYTQHLLKSDPALFLRDRPTYFGKKQIAMAGDLVSLENIEHGVLRRGATIYTLGHVRTLMFRSAFIQRFAVTAVDYRIHFALNCGATSCPAVMPYTADALDTQLDAITGDYLAREARYDVATDEMQVPALLRWFSADFDGGGVAAKRRILQRHGVLPEGANPKLSYRPYDWTLQVRNYALFVPSALDE